MTDETTRVKQNILVIDDDKPVHIMTDNLFGSNFGVYHAKDAQKAIDIISKEPIHLVLSDIHMPGLSGLELLQSLRIDPEKRRIPILIMTNLPSVEKEIKGNKLGAADFIEKVWFTNRKEEVLERVRMKLVTDLQVNQANEELRNRYHEVVSAVLDSAVTSDFYNARQTLCDEVGTQFNADCCLILNYMDDQPHVDNIFTKDGLEVPDVSQITPYEYSSYKNRLENDDELFSNNVFNGEQGILINYCKNNELPVELAVPLFAADEKQLLLNGFKAPGNSNIFGILIIKRQRVMASDEARLIDSLIRQSASILWRMANKSVSS